MFFFANSEDPDEMQHNAAFHQGLHCYFIRVYTVCKEKKIFRQKNTILFFFKL